MLRWTIIFTSACVGVLALAFGLIWLADGFVDLGLSLNGKIALAIGITATAGLGFALMALVFYSERSGADDAVHDAHDLDPHKPPGPQR